MYRGVMIEKAPGTPGRLLATHVKRQRGWIDGKPTTDGFFWCLTGRNSSFVAVYNAIAACSECKVVPFVIKILDPGGLR